MNPNSIDPTEKLLNIRKALIPYQSDEEVAQIFEILGDITTGNTNIGGTQTFYGETTQIGLQINQAITRTDLSADVERLLRDVLEALNPSQLPLEASERQLNRVFISYSRRNSPFARQLAASLSDAGLDVWIDYQRIRGGEDWWQSIVDGITRADYFVPILSPSAAESSIVRREIVTAQEHDKFTIPVMVEEAIRDVAGYDEIGWLTSRHIINFQKLGFGQAFREVLLSLPGFKPPDSYQLENPSKIPNPYRGLEPFREVDTAYFAGREREVHELTGRLLGDETRFLAVLGASGSGKSSLVRAGLVPSLRLEEAFADWQMLTITPGDDPVEALAARLLMLVSAAEADIPEHDEDGEAFAAWLTAQSVQLDDMVERLMNKKEALHRLVEDHLGGRPASARLAIFIDQFEEVFTRTRSVEKRRSFLELVHHAATKSGGRAQFIVTMRSDFTDRVSAYPNAAMLFNNNYIVADMRLDQLRKSIERPAGRVGLKFETGLVDQILEEVVEQPGVLPLLQYALREMVNLRKNSTILTSGIYNEIGGVSGALANNAERFFATIKDDPAQVEALRRLLLRLVDVNPDGEATRRRVRREVLTTSPYAADLIGQLTDSKYRLLVTHRALQADAEQQTTWVEVSHEALMREWDRFRRWIDQNSGLLITSAELLQRAQEWDARDRAEGELLGPERVEEASRWLTEGKDVIPIELVQSDFVRASEEREIRRQRAATRRTRTTIGGLAVVLVIISGLSIFLFQAQQAATQNAATAVFAEGVARDNEVAALTAQANAEQERDRADEAARVAQSGSVALRGVAELRAGRVDTALLLGITAFDIADTAEARGTLLASLQSVEGLREILHDHTAPVTTTVYSPDGNFFATADQNGTIILWDDRSSEPLGPSLNHGAIVWSLALSPDGATLYSAGGDGAVRAWNVETGMVGEVFAAFEDEIAYALALSADGERMLVGYSNNASPEASVARLWDVVAGEVLFDFAGHTDSVYTVALAEDGTQALTGSADTNVILWKLGEDGSPIGSTLLSGHQNWVWDVAFHPAQPVVASASADGTIRLWDTETNEPTTVLENHTDWVRDVTFNRAGTMMMTASRDGTVILYDESYRPARTLTAHTDEVWEAAFSADEDTVITVGEDTQVLRWDRILESRFSTTLNGEGEVYDVIFLSNVGQLITAHVGDPGQLLFWDVATGRVARDPIMADSGVLTVDTNETQGLLAFGTEDGVVHMYEVTTGSKMWASTGHRGPVRSVTLAPDGGQLLSSSDDGQVMAWDTETGSQVREPLIAHDGERIRTMAYAPDGATFATGGDDGRVILWSAETGEQVRTLPETGEAEVEAVAFSHSGTLLVAAGRDNRARVWDLTQPDATPRLLVGHESWVFALAFSPDDRFLVTGGRDDTAILWDISSGGTIGGPLVGHNGWIWGAAFNQDGTMFATGARDGTARLWDVDVETWRAAACSVANRGLSQDEGQRLIGGAMSSLTVCDTDTG